MPLRPLQADDVFNLLLVSDPRVSPDGGEVAYVCQWTDRDQNRYFSNLWLVSTDGARRRPLTRGDQADNSPRWSPDGRRLAFISDRGDRQQVWLIPSDGGEAARLTDFPPGGIADLSWSPDGTRLLCTRRATPEFLRKESVEAREKAKRSTPPVRITRLRYREEGVGYFHDEYRHVYVIDAANGATAAVTGGKFEHDAPVWSPDGRRVAFVTNRSADPEVTPWLREIRIVDLGDPDRTAQAVPAPVGPKHHLSWSPDGRSLAWYGHTDIRDAWSSRHTDLWTLDLETGEVRNLSARLDRPVGDSVLGDVRSFGAGEQGPLWSRDSTAIWFLVSDSGRCHAYRTTRDGASLPVNQTPGFDGEVASLSLTPGGEALVAAAGHPARPGDVARFDLARPGSEPRYLTEVNAEALAGVRLIAPEEVLAPGEAGSIQGWLLRPAGEGPHPLLLYIHGGPHAQYGLSFMHELQVHAANGLAVLYSNPRGSTGRGQAWLSGIDGDWGGPDYRDLMAITDYAAGLPGIDGSRLAVTGGSYGGFMTNWILGETGRFLCGVTQRSVVNMHSMSGTCDFCYSDSGYFDANAWTRPERFLAQSPLSRADRINTPLLIIHSEGDLRCPIEQAEQLYAALRRQGKTVEFLRFPREANHGLSRSGPPDLRLARIEAIVEWLDRWVRPTGPQGDPARTGG